MKLNTIYIIVLFCQMLNQVIDYFEGGYIVAESEQLIFIKKTVLIL